MYGTPSYFRRALFCFLVFLSLTTISRAQTTQGLISGQVVDMEDGNPIPNARVTYLSLATNTTGTALTSPFGFYFLPLLPPGNYRIRVTADRYQAQELQELELSVAAFLDVNFRLRPVADVWEGGQYRSVFLPGTRTVLTFFGPDVDTTHSSLMEGRRGTGGGLESTVSHVIDPAQVRELPLAGRDVYTMLVTQPGVTADTATARGLGLSVNGQRHSASNFLLDGLQNNNFLVTGPLTAVAPEAVQEYRVSTNNFSAEYGRTSGFLANAVTRSGGGQLHGLGYYYLKNEALNANDFQKNLEGLPRVPAKESHIGFSVGGPLRAGSLFASGSFEYRRSRSRGDTLEFQLPTPAFLAFTAPNSIARQLLEQFPAPEVSDRNLFTAKTNIAPPVSVNRYLALPRVDYQSVDGTHRLMARLALSKLDRPDFVWSPYEDFISPLSQNTISLAFRAISSLRPNLVNEAKFGWNSDDLGWDRPQPQIPTLASGDGTSLPGSPVFYEYSNRSRSWELIDNLLWTHGRHIIKAGGGLLLRRVDGFLTAGRDPLVLFSDIISFALDRPGFMAASVSRENLPNLATPEYDREYSNNQFFFFAQDSFKLTPRLVLNFGIRYENFGAPRNTGSVKDGIVELGGGDSFPQRLASASLTFPQGGDQQLYQSDSNDWAGRFGFSYSLRENAGTVLRGSYGIFYDRPFDNLWQNLRANNTVLGSFRLRAASTDYLQPVSSLLPGFEGSSFAQDFPQITAYQPELRNAYVQSYFLGLQHELGETLTLEVNGLGSLGRKLITTDIVNREFSVPIDPDNFLKNPFGRFNPNLGRLSYRANQGTSNYNALIARLRHRGRSSQLQVAYTWSRTIDIQSEPLAGDFFDLSFTRVSSGAGGSTTAAFARQFDGRGDRGNSDFDQRHNLVILSIWDLPDLFSSSQAGVLFRDWQFSQMAAFRSGFPFTVRAPIRFSFDGELVINNRADLIDPARADAGETVADGGQQLLNAAAFREPAAGTLGNSGRNAFRGPGLFNIDLSLSRSFRLPWLGEAGRLTFRADAFNVLNHANLNNPDSFFTSETFGLALFGRQGRDTGFPAVTPFNETARQLQFLLRIEF